MQKPTLRRNGKKEVILRVDFHFNLRDLAEIAITACHSRNYFPDTQKKFEEKIRFYLYQPGCIDETNDYPEDEIKEFMDDIKQLYLNYEWE